MKRILSTFFKFLIRSLLILAISTAAIFFLTDIHPGKFISFAAKAIDSVDQIKEAQKLQSDLAQLDPNQAEDFEKIKDLALEQRRLHANLTEEFTGEEMKDLMGFHEKLKTRLPQLEKVPSLLEEHPFLLEAFSVVNKTWMSSREFAKSVYETHILPWFE